VVGILCINELRRRFEMPDSLDEGNWPSRECGLITFSRVDYLPAVVICGSKEGGGWWLVLESMTFASECQSVEKMKPRLGHN
jgi:hypothetical protein